MYLQHGVLEGTLAYESEGRSSRTRVISRNLPRFLVQLFGRQGNETCFVLGFLLFCFIFRFFWIRFHKTSQVVQSKYSQRLMTKQNTSLTRRNNSTPYPIPKLTLLPFYFAPILSDRLRKVQRRPNHSSSFVEVMNFRI